MESLIEYFSDMPSLHRSILLVGGLTIFLLLENASPLFSINYKRWKHAGLNIFFTFTTVVVNFAMAFLLVLASQWPVEHHFGIIQWLDLPLWASAIVGLLIMDFFAAWFAHWVHHHVQWMWKFHIIHHSDQHVDTTTANRHHPGESILRFIFTLIAVIIVGAPMWLVFLYQSLSLIMTQFNHSNVKMPDWLDNSLVKVLCTPNMHRVHHHYREPYSNTNYGNIFSFWDRIFGTYVEVNNTKLVYGLDTHMDTSEVDSMTELLKIPFLKYREKIDYQDVEKL